MNPLCDLLLEAFNNGIEDLNRAIKMKDAISKSVNTILEVTDPATLNNQIPDMNLTLNLTQINDIINSCPGQFPNIAAINTQATKFIKDYLNRMNGSPLGQLSSFIKTLDDMSAPLKDTVDTLYNYLTCLQKICNLANSDFSNYWTQVTNLKSQLNMDANGKINILDNTTKNALDSYQTKITSVKNQLSIFK